MTEHTTYICDYCGEVFGNEDNCLRHEWEHRFELLKNRVKFMRVKNGVLIELPLACESVDECTVIYCDGTDEVWNTLDEAFSAITPQEYEASEQVWDNLYRERVRLREELQKVDLQIRTVEKIIGQPIKTIDK